MVWGTAQATKAGVVHSLNVTGKDDSLWHIRLARTLSNALGGTEFPRAESSRSHWIPMGVYHSQVILSSLTPTCVFPLTRQSQSKHMQGLENINALLQVATAARKSETLPDSCEKKASHCFSPEGSELSMSWEHMVNSWVQFRILLWRWLQGSRGIKRDCHNKEVGGSEWLSQKAE